MKLIQSIDIHNSSKEELLPGYSEAFPYISSRVEFDRYFYPGAPWHWHRTVELFYVPSGTLEYTTPGGRWVFPAGSAGFINANTLHSSNTESVTASTVQMLHLFDPVFLAGYHGSTMESKYILPLTGRSDLDVIVLSPEDSSQAEIIDEIRQAFDIPESCFGYEFRLRGALTSIWLKLLALIQQNSPMCKDHGQTDTLVKAMMVYIHEHYHQHISVDDLASVSQISRRACFRTFQQNLHMSPVEYIRSYRLKIACHMLLSTDDSISQIASRCFLGSSSYFGKLFREQYGCSPREYRRNWHNRENNCR